MTLRPATIVFAAAVAGIAATAGAQPMPSCASSLGAVRTATDTAARRNAAIDLVKMNLHPDCLAEVLALSAAQRTAFAQLIKRFESVRTDKQAGAGAGSGGSTTLVAQGMTARILSVAAEYGALTQSVNKQIVTLQGSLDAVPALLVRHDLVPYCPDGDRTPECLRKSTFDMLRRVSYGVSFDTSQSAQTVSGTASADPTQPVTFDASGHTINGFTIRVILWSERDASSQAFQDKWTSQLQAAAAVARIRAAAATLQSAMGALLDDLENDPAKIYETWQKEAADKLADAPTGVDVDRIWIVEAEALGAAVRATHPDVFDKAARFLQTLSAYRFEQDDLITSLAVKPVLTVEYANKRPTGEPTASSVRAIFDKGVGKDWWMALNGAVEFYDRQPPATIPGARRLRDWQAAVELRRSLGTIAFLGAASIGGGYYFQHQVSPAILEVTPDTPLPGVTLSGLPPGATEVFADTGSLHVAQLRLVLGPPDSSARFPLSVTWSNRTELITHPVLRAQIGVSYDFDSLFAR